MRRVIIESPYAGDVDTNIQYARAAVVDCLCRGEVPIASHLLYTQHGILDDNDPYDRSLGIIAGLAWHLVADAVVVYTDLGISHGMQTAIDHAGNINKPIEYRSLGRAWAPIDYASP